MKEKSNAKPSTLSRTFDLAKMAIKVGIKELGSKNLASRIEQARIITESLSRLKGAAMKGGQLLSIDIGDYFPPEAAVILSQLQNSATASSYEDVMKIILSEMGQDKFSLLNDFSIKPIASASIAQVHTANYMGRKLAVKVQHPNIAESIDSDLLILKNLANGLSLLSGRKVDFEMVFSEFKSVLENEVNFESEAAFLKQYKINLTGLNKGQNRYYAPDLIEEFSSKKVLTMSWEEGISFNQWLQSKPSAEKRMALAHLLLDLYFYEFFKCGLVQTDPNFSNFLVRENNDGIALVLLDFGATRRYTPEFVSNYSSLLKIVAENDSQKTIDASIRFELLDSRESEETKNHYLNMMKVSIEPFQLQSKSTEKFNYGDKDYSKRTIESVRQFVTSLRYTPPPHQLIFLHRKLGGIFSALKRMEVELDVRPYWEQMIGSGK